MMAGQIIVVAKEGKPGVFTTLLDAVLGEH